MSKLNRIELNLQSGNPSKNAHPLGSAIQQHKLIKGTT